MCWVVAMLTAVMVAPQASAQAAASSPTSPSTGRSSPALFDMPVFREGAAVRARCDAALQDLSREARVLERGGKPILTGLDDLELLGQQRIGVLDLVANVHPDKSVRDASEACLLRYQAFTSQLNQNATLYGLLLRARPEDAIDASLQRSLLDGFVDAGVSLDPRARARVQKLSAELTRLSQAFDRTLREEKVRLAFTEAELEGVPPGVWQQAPRDAQGRALLGLDYPTLYPVLESARRGATRERMWRAYLRQGGASNLALLDRIAVKRRGLASLFGLPSYAEFKLRRRMAHDPGRLEAFLGQVKGAVQARELRDIEELRQAKARDLGAHGGAAAATTLQRWDVAYYTELVKRQRFEVDQEAFRKHFPPQASVDFVFALAGRLFNVGFRPVAAPVWHPDVQAFEVLDLGQAQAAPTPIATLFLDLYPRDDKYGHAAMWPLTNGSVRRGVPPAAALVTNFDRQGLTLSELETLLHEFGHALHQTLTRTRHASNGGTSVKLDFVEAPSQMLEEWVYDPRVLALFQQVCAGCPPVPDGMLKKAREARGFAKGLHYARQHLYASYDQSLHGPAPEKALPLWQRMEGATPLGHVPGTIFPAGFSHIASHYGAGYYAYLWSLALAQDLFTAFDQDPLDASVGRRYRDDVLSRGGEDDPDVLVNRFLQRPPSNEAFFRWLED